MLFIFPNSVYLSTYSKCNLRQLINQGEILNCDLTDRNSSTLDQYNTEQFVVNAVTDFYDRVDVHEGQDCSLIEKAHWEEPLKVPKRPSLLQPHNGNDQLSVRLDNLEIEASGWKNKTDPCNFLLLIDHLH